MPGFLPPDSRSIPRGRVHPFDFGLAGDGVVYSFSFIKFECENIDWNKCAIFGINEIARVGIGDFNSNVFVNKNCFTALIFEKTVFQKETLNLRKIIF